MKQNRQNIQNPKRSGDGTQLGCRRKAGRLAAFPNQEKGFDGFAGFVKTNAI
jgi:hypothetical protein